MEVEKLRTYTEYLKNNGYVIDEYKEELIALCRGGNIDDILIRFMELIENNFINEDIPIDGERILPYIVHNRQLYLNGLLTLYFARDLTNQDANLHIYCIIYSIVEIDMMLNKVPDPNDPAIQDYMPTILNTINTIYINQHFPQKIQENQNLINTIHLFIKIFVLTN